MLTVNIIMGDEILRDQIIDTNTSYLARSFTAAEVNSQRVVVVPDVVKMVVVKGRPSLDEYFKLQKKERIE